MPSASDIRTGAPSPLVGNRPQSPLACAKDVETACDAYIRDTPGLSFDRVGLALGLDGETLRLMLDPGDRRQLGASRLLRLLRAFGTPEPLNAVARLPGNEIGGLTHQLVPVVVRPCSGDLLGETAAGARECTTALEALISCLADGVDPIEAATLLRLYRPLSERLLGVVAQLEAIARRQP